MPEEQIAVAIEMKAAFVPWTENSFPGLLGNVISVVLLTVLTSVVSTQ